jgi:TMEM175 potassium channel family protein
MSNQPKSIRQLIYSVQLSKGRMEALTDGIFAIAMTLLVLELKMPDLPKHVGSRELLEKLGEQMPSFFSFLVSFLYCGLLWIQHHLAMHFVRHIKTGLVWINLIFLMSISVLPFSCALLGHFLRNLAAREIYFGNLFVAASLMALQWMLVRRQKLLIEDDPRALKAVGEQLMMLPVAVAAGMVVTPLGAEPGLYAMSLVLLGLRIWQKKAAPRDLIAPSSPTSS